MSYSETITRTDLANILNEVLPFSFTEFRHHTGTVTVANNTLVQPHSETFTDGSWLILTTLETLSGGSTTANVGQNRILKDGTLVYAHKSQADISVVNTNFYVLKNANNTTITLESFQSTGNSQSQEWTFTAIRIGDKFAEPSADYIVEQSTNTNGTYRKWNSGLAECWGIGQIGSNSACTVNYPMTFNTTSGMTLIASCEYSGSLTYVAPTISVQKYVDHANLYARVSTSTTPAGYYVDYYVKGTWK